MSLTEFKQPEWLDGITTRGIEEKMMSNLPLDIDKTEGGFAWDLTYPTAIEKAEMLQYYMVMALKTMFPQWAEGRWLDYQRSCASGGESRLRLRHRDRQSRARHSTGICVFRPFG